MSGPTDPPADRPVGDDLGGAPPPPPPPPPPPGEGYPNQQYGQPQYAQQQYGGPPPQGNGLAVTGLVLGILGVIFAFIPFAGVFFAFLFGILAAIFGGIGLAKSKEPNRGGKGMGIAGLVLGIIAILLGIGQIAFWGAAAESVVNDPQFQEDLEELENQLEEFGTS